MRYQRANVAAGSYFFTVNLLDRQQGLLVEYVGVLRKKRVRLDCLLKSKLALVRMTVGHANCINTPELKSRRGHAPSDNKDSYKRKINKWLERNASPAVVGEQSKHFGMRQALPFLKRLLAHNLGSLRRRLVRL